MTTRRKWLLATTFSVLVVVALIYLAVPREPRYKGRPLSAWVADLSEPGYQRQRAAREAIQNMGAEAVPFLTNSLAQRDALSVRIYRKGFIPRRLVAWSHRLVQWHSASVEGRSAALALQSVGPTGAGAIPALVNALDDPDIFLAQSAADALAAIGTNSLAPLRARLSAPKAGETYWVLRAIGGLGTNAAPAAVQIVPLIEFSDPSVADAAMSALIRIGPRSAAAVTNLLTSTNSKVVVRALNVLNQCGPAALFATNAVFPLVEHPDPNVRYAARGALAAWWPPPEVGNPIWLSGLHDPDIRNVEISLRQLTMHPVVVRAFAREIAALANHPTNHIRGIATNALTMFHAWPDRPVQK